jgi:hypothetical protein
MSIAEKVVAKDSVLDECTIVRTLVLSGSV